MVASSDVCPTEDAIQVFLQHLVDPLLPEKASVRDNPTASQQQVIAKQVHSVVLLYNYYHRKQHPELEYLPFNEFCKLIVVLRPPLLAYMKFMQKINEVELIDVEKQLSLTEKGIMDACDICNCLDASKNVPNIEGWPISKVSVLLIDSKKENCFLLFGSITEEVWSVVEKSIDTSSQNSEVSTETKNTYKRRRVIRKPAKDEVKVDEDRLLQVGYSAVKEAAGINNTDIMLLGSYTVYSQSKEKEASRFYIMQCSQSINQEVIKVPLKDVIESLQGPLVKKSSSSWTITPVVVYFHVLPYSEVISQGISRNEFSNSLQNSRVAEKNIMVDSPEVTESYISKDMYSGMDYKPSEDDIEMHEQKENNGSCTLKPCDSIMENHEMDVNKSSIYPSQNKEKCQKITNTIQFGEHQEKNNPSVQFKSNGSANAIQAMKIDSTRMLNGKGGVNNIASCSKLCANKQNTSYEKDTTGACTPSSNHSNSDKEKPQSLQDSKKRLRTAISSLIRKRNELALQQRKIEGEIASVDEQILRMLTGSLNRKDFPEGFIFGTASSAYQYEGAASEGGRGPSIWDTFTHRYPQKISDGNNGDVAVDSYHRYKEDVGIMKDMNLDAYRFSISWSRILPDGKLSGGINQEGIDYYNNLINELVANGLQPFVTLFHWDLPQTLEDEYGGFLSPLIIKDFQDYAELCFKTFGDRVKHWITLNEPWTYSQDGYANGEMAPGRCSSWLNPNCTGGDSGTEPYLVAHYQLLAHAAVVNLYKTKYQISQKGVIGITLVINYFVPLSDNKLDIKAAERATDFMFGWFMDPLANGDYPKNMRALVRTRLPKFTKEQSRLVSGSFDFIGINYYSSCYASDAPQLSNGKPSYLTDSLSRFSFERDGKTIGLNVASNWLYVYPRAIRDFLIQVKEKYNNPLIYITENGINEYDDPSLSLEESLMDTYRVDYHYRHLFYLNEAIKAGVNVKGYFAWSLLDNFEWHKGYTVRFGMTFVDYKNGLKRYQKLSGLWFKNFLTSENKKVYIDSI